MTELKKEKTQPPILEYGILAAVVIASLLFIYQIKTQDINLARSVLTGLAGGRYGVEKYIDWENLKGLEVNVGATYNKFPNQIEKVGYKRSFIQNFAVGFKQAKGDLRAFTNWRVYSKNSSEVVVAADYQGRNKTLLFAIPAAGKKKITSIQWKQ